MHELDALRSRVDKMIADWGSALVEKYVDGREFSVLIVGNKDKSHVYTPVEYVFDAQRAKAAFITFEDKWISCVVLFLYLALHQLITFAFAAMKTAGACLMLLVQRPNSRRSSSRLRSGFWLPLRPRATRALTFAKTARACMCWT